MIFFVFQQIRFECRKSTKPVAQSCNQFAVCQNCETSVRHGFHSWLVICVCRMQAIAKSERVIYQWTGFQAALRLCYRSLGDMERSVSTRHDTGLIWIPCSRCKNVWWAKWLAFQWKDLASEVIGSGGAGLGCGLGHVWGEIRNGMLLGNPARGRRMLFASDELTAALKFQRQR